MVVHRHRELPVHVRFSYVLLPVPSAMVARVSTRREAVGTTTQALCRVPLFDETHGLVSAPFRMSFAGACIACPSPTSDVCVSDKSNAHVCPGSIRVQKETIRMPSVGPSVQKEGSPFKRRPLSPGNDWGGWKGSVNS